MKTAFYQRLMIAALIIILTIQVIQWRVNRAQVEINTTLIDRVAALKYENAAQWQRISELEIMLCNPERIKCGK